MLSRSIRKLPVAILAIGLMFALTASAASAAPSRTTEKAKAIDNTFATLNGTINVEGHKTDYQFVYSTSPEWINWYGTPIQTTESASPLKVSAKINGLELGTKYYFVIVTHDYATGEFKTGETLSFTTLNFYHTTQFMTPSTPQMVAGNNSVARELELKGAKGETLLYIECETVELWQILQQQNSTALSLNVEFNESKNTCKASGGTATVLKHSCRFVFNLANSGPPHTGNFGIACTVENDFIEFKTNLGCTVKVGAQTPSAGSLSYENQADGTVRTSGSATNVKWTAEGSLCKLAGIEPSGETGVMAIDAKVEAEKSELFVSGSESDVGVFTGGGKIEAALYPAKIYGSNSAANQFEAAGVNFKVSCGTANLTGPLPAGASSLTMTPELTSCKVTGGTVTVKPNSCQYVLNVAGGLSIACSKEGDAIEFNTNLGCNLKVGPQTPGGSLSYTNQGAGVRRTVRAQGSATGIKWTSSGALCTLGGIGSSGEDGKIAIDSSLGGIYTG